MSNCYLYLIIEQNAPETYEGRDFLPENYVKIGVSDEPANRLKNLRTANPRDIAIEAIYSFKNREVAMGFESLFHEKYSRKNISGEWFSYDNDMLRGISAVLSFLGVFDEAIHQSEEYSMDFLSYNAAIKWEKHNIKEVEKKEIGGDDDNIRLL
tara:strand:- start:930 stop:1391 length:462 start_codon:yes stop_codon:yes gene_type:complete